VSVERFLALIDYNFRWSGNTLPFVSYVFHLCETGGELCCIDTVEGITGFREATINELSQVATKLERLEPRWQDWGNFRAVAHHVVETLLPG
jgi:hypothetical protein